MTWSIRITPTALEMLKAVKDARERKLLAKRIDKLAENPDKQGKGLRGELTGYRSIRAVGQRYRIIYWLDGGEVVVTVVALGRRQDSSRRDIYELARKILKSGLG